MAEQEARWRINCAEESPTQTGQSHQQGSTGQVHGIPGATTSGGGITNTERLEGESLKGIAYERVRSSQGKGAHACLRAVPTDKARETGPKEFTYALRRALGIEEFLASGCPRCHRGREQEGITTLHARTCHRDGAQVNMHEPLKFASSKALNGMGVRHDLESGAPFTGERNLSMDIVIRPGTLSNASSSEYRNKGILLDVTHADLQAQVHLRNGSATSDGTAAQASEARKRQHYARPGHVSFDERSFKHTTLAVESFGRLGEEGYEFINELATHAAGGRNGGSIALKRGFQRATSSGRISGYPGSHI